MHCRLSISRECNCINRYPLLRQIGKPALKFLIHLIPSRKRCILFAVLVPSALTVNAVKTAPLAKFWQKVHSQRAAKPAALYRPEHYLVKQKKVLAAMYSLQRKRSSAKTKTPAESKIWLIQSAIVKS